MTVENTGTFDQPLFVFGCPRSGTTFLGEVLNRHPRVLVSNELRVMSFFAEVLNVHARNVHLIHNPDLREEFLAHLRRQTAHTVRSFYLNKFAERFAATDRPEPIRVERDGGTPRQDSLPAGGPIIWGDKTPGYADPVLSPACLETIDELFPSAKYIHITRDPRAVVRSLTAKRWYTLEDSIDLWARIVRRGRAWTERVGPARCLEISYEQLCGDGHAVARELFQFLGLETAAGVQTFLDGEARERTLFSDPVTLKHAIGGSTEQQLAAGILLDTNERVPPLSEKALQVLELAFGPTPGDITSALAAHAQQAAERAGLRRAVITLDRAGNGSEISATSTNGVYTTQAVSAPTRTLASGFIEVPPEALIGKLDARIIGVKARVHEGDTVRRGTVLSFAAKVHALKNLAEIIVGFTAYDTDGRPVFHGNSVGSGLGALAMEVGPRVAEIDFAWPDVPAGVYSLTFGIGEGTDPVNHTVQCWAEKQVRVNAEGESAPPSVIGTPQPCPLIAARVE
jgi:hypothetical protein